uniref:Uncharacterized protein n=1 Tax=Arundo donax TaxID=35708 RepID=A0A0A8Y558_ARUDO
MRNTTASDEQKFRENKRKVLLSHKMASNTLG